MKLFVLPLFFTCLLSLTSCLFNPSKNDEGTSIEYSVPFTTHFTVVNNASAPKSITLWQVRKTDADRNTWHSYTQKSKATALSNAETQLNAYSSSPFPYDTAVLSFIIAIDEKLYFGFAKNDAFAKDVSQELGTRQIAADEISTVSSSYNCMTATVSAPISTGSISTEDIRKTHNGVGYAAYYTMTIGNDAVHFSLDRIEY